MPPRDPQLPEGTDKVITGAAEEERGGSSGGFVASGGHEGGTGEKLVTQVREQVITLRGQAADKMRAVADDGKGRATTLLDDIAAVIDDAARSIDDRLGQEYGDYAHRASGAVSDFAGRMRGKSVDDLVEDTRSFVRKSPTVAIAAAAVVGFALIRVIRTGLEDVGASERSGSRSGGGRTRRTRANTDTTAGGGA